MALADEPTQAHATALAAAALGHADFVIREEAIYSLVEQDGALAVHTLQQALRDPSPRVRVAAVRVLGDLGGREAVHSIGNVLVDDDVSLRLEAVDALGSIGGTDAALYLQQAVGDPSEVVREAAGQWLDELSQLM